MSSSTGTVVFNDSRVRAVDVIANEKVGIGTSLPAYALDVHGTANVGTMNVETISSNVLFNGSATFDKALSVSGNLNASGDIKLSNAFFMNNTVIFHKEYEPWTQMGQDIYGEAGGDFSGTSVSLSSDGTRMAIGAHLNDGNGSNSGHTRIWEWNGSTWTQMGQDIDGEAADDYSGYSVSLSSDGTRVAIGAYQNDGGGNYSGHTRIWEWNSGTSTWTQMGQDIDGETLINYSGYSVSISSDGTRVAIGAYLNNGNGWQSGHTRIWEWDSVNSVWTQMGQDIDGEASSNRSGYSVSLSGDGTRVAIGAIYNDGGGTYGGHARIWEWNPGTSTWIQMGQDIDGEAQHDDFGTSVSLSSDGTRVAIGANENDGSGSNSGHVRVYEWNSGTSTWTQMGQDIDGEAAGDQSGYSVSLSSNGTRVAIGARYNDGNGYNSGHTRIWEWNPVTSTWIQIGQDLDGEAADDHFGLSVSLSGDGTRVAIGAPSNASGQTRVYQIGDPKAVFPGRVSTSNLEVGTDLQVVGNAYVSSNLEIGTANLFVDTTTGRVGVGTTQPSADLDVKGTLKVSGGNITTDQDVIVDDIEKFPLMPVHGPIGREDLYTWDGAGSATVVNNSSSTQYEPFHYNSGFARLTSSGATFTSNYSHWTSKWNESYLIETKSLSTDTDGNLASPANYAQISLPVQYINGKTCSHALFLRFVNHDRWSAVCAYVANSDGSQVYRLQASTNSEQSGADNCISSWIGPNGDMSMSHLYHEWQMFSIPEYIVESYSYSETRDNKSKYQRNINVRFCVAAGNTNGTTLYLSGIAMRTNPYGLTIHKALPLHWAMNGGTAFGWYSDNWHGEGMTIVEQGTNYTNVLVPICPPKDPDIYGYPDFYLGYVGHRSDFIYERKPKIYLHHSTGYYKYLGRPAIQYKGRFGHFTSSYRGSVRSSGFGVYVPSPDPGFIVKVQGRPYLRIRVDNTNNGWGTHRSHHRGLYTEVVYRDGSIDGLGDNGQQYI